MDLGKLLRREVKATLWPFLRAQGFTEFSDLAAWRRGARWIDCVQMMTLGATQFGVPNDIGWRGSERIHANPATFSLELGCYYTDVHLLPWTGPAPDRPRCPRGQGPRYPTCHRLRSLARSYEYANVRGTLFPSAHDGSDLQHSVEDALQALRSRGMTWLEAAHDIDAYLARLDQEPSEYLERGGSVFKTREEEPREFRAERNGIEQDGILAFMGNVEVPPVFQRMQRESNLRDHTSAEPMVPYGDLLYGLLVGAGRVQEAVEAMRRDSTPDEGRYGEMLSAGLSRREVKALRKREDVYFRNVRHHLAMLEVSLRDEAAY